MSQETTPASFPLKYDETAPQAGQRPGLRMRAAEVQPGGRHLPGRRWHLRRAEAAPRSPMRGLMTVVALSGTCLDRARQPEPLKRASRLKYDETAPQAGTTASQGADANGWYNHPLTVSFNGNDTQPRGSNPATRPKSYSGPDVAERLDRQLLPRRRGQRGSALGRRRVRRNGAASNHDPGAGRERLQAAGTTLRSRSPREHGRDAPASPRASDRRATPVRTAPRRISRRLLRPGRQRSQRLVRAQVRRNGASGECRTGKSRPTRTAGTASAGLVRRDGRDFGRRLLRRGGKNTRRRTPRHCHGDAPPVSPAVFRARQRASGSSTTEPRHR